MRSKNSRCFLCCEPKVLTEEHIIPQALGGKLSDWIYCKDCNDTLGSEIDSELCKRLGYFCTALKISRDRGKIQPCKIFTTKDNIELVYDGTQLVRSKPSVKIEKEGKTIDVRAGTENGINEIVSGIRKKYKLPDEAGKKFKEEHAGPTDLKGRFVFGNSLIYRAVSKIAYGLICMKIPVSYLFSFNDIRNYIRLGSGDKLATTNFLHTGFMTDYTRPLHKIHISFNRQKNLLVGFVSLFGIFRYTVLLSKNLKSSVEWSGLDYTFDPVTSKEVHGNPNFRAPDLDINQILSPRDLGQLRVRELTKGNKILENYIENYKFLRVE